MQRSLFAPFALTLFLCAPLLSAQVFEPANPLAPSTVLYEVQIRSANACDPNTGSFDQQRLCLAKIAPQVRYRGESWASDSYCEGQTAEAALAKLNRIKLGTIEDMLEPHADFRLGITLRYIREKVGANTVWIMPLFPNNTQWNLPNRCDNIGSPYASRDYMHVRPSLARVCIVGGSDEFSAEKDFDPARCHGNYSFSQLLAEAKRLGLRVILDIALNHFGHNYLFYDTPAQTPIREFLAQSSNPSADLNDFDRTFDESLIRPEVLDTPEKLNARLQSDALSQQLHAELKSKCPRLGGSDLVRGFGMYREMLDWERQQLSCTAPTYLEFWAPGFYLGARHNGATRPSNHVGDNFTNEWVDVKFLYHHDTAGADERGPYMHSFLRNREYHFRIMNYWVAQGVDGFRLDHATDHDSGMNPNEWRYLMRKVNYYDFIRKGRPQNYVPPIYLVEEFGDQMGMNQVADIMIDGYVGAMRHAHEKDSAHVRRILEQDSRFNPKTLVMRALETHDEPRLMQSTGFDAWTGAGFWGIGAASRGVPMLLMGQEFGSTKQLSFKRSEFLPARFLGQSEYRNDADKLISFYKNMIQARLNGVNAALQSPQRYFLERRDRQQSGQSHDPRLFAQLKWNDDGNALFVFHNLWSKERVSQSYFISPDIAGRIGIRDSARYKLVNAFSDELVSPCQSGAQLKSDLFVSLEGHERLQWLRMERCID